MRTCPTYFDDNTVRFCLDAGEHHWHEWDVSHPSSSTSHTRYPKRKAAYQAICRGFNTRRTRWQVIRLWSDYMSECEGQEYEDKGTWEDKLGKEDLIPNPILHGLGFEAMLRSTLLSKKSVKKPRTWGMTLLYMTRADARCLGENDLTSPGSALAIIGINDLLEMYIKDAFKPWCYPTALGLKLSRMMPSWPGRGNIIQPLTGVKI